MRLVRGVRPEGGVQIGVFHFDGDSELGAHEATMPQLFLVVSGAGWVSGADGVCVPIAEGTAAFFARGERHASGSDGAMTAVVVEAESLDPAEFLAEIDLPDAAPERYALVYYRDSERDAVRASFFTEDEVGAASFEVVRRRDAVEMTGAYFFCELAGGAHRAEILEALLARIARGESVRVIRGPYATKDEADGGLGDDWDALFG